MKLRLHVWPLQVPLLLLCLSANATAQTTTSGALTGVVADPSGAVVPNADVEIKDDTRAVSTHTKVEHTACFNYGGYWRNSVRWRISSCGGPK